MPSLREIEMQIKNLDGASKLFGRKEIKELPNILWEDERVEKIVQGFYNNGTGILVATNKRLIFVDKGLLFGIKVEDFPYEKISSIQYSTGMLLGDVTIFTSGNKAKIENIDKKQARDFGDYVRARITGTKGHASFQNNDVQADVVSQLERLAKLKEQGILTENEFTEQKRRILGK